MVKELKRQKRRELSLPGVASMGGADYDFFEESIANRLAVDEWIGRASWPPSRGWWTRSSGGAFDTIGRPGANRVKSRLQMVKLFGARIRLFASVMLISTTALAQQEITSPPTKEIEKHLHNYDNFDNTCIRWTDKCRNCSRSTSGDHPVCSNIGIVCASQHRLNVWSGNRMVRKSEDGVKDRSVAADT